MGFFDSFRSKKKEATAETLGRGFSKIILSSLSEAALSMTNTLNIDPKLSDKLPGEIMMLQLYLYSVVFRNEIKNDEFRKKLLDNLHSEMIERLKMPTDYYFKILTNHFEKYQQMKVMTYGDIVDHAPYIFIEILEGKSKYDYTSVDEYAKKWGRTIIYLKEWIRSYIESLNEASKTI